MFVMLDTQMMRHFVTVWKILSINVTLHHTPKINVFMLFIFKNIHFFGQYCAAVLFDHKVSIQNKRPDNKPSVLHTNKEL